MRATIEADDMAALKGVLAAQGLIPLSISLKAERGLASTGGFTLKRATQRDLLQFTQELASLLESGLQIDRALYTLSEHSEKPVVRETVRHVYTDIQRGQALSQALSKHRMFPDIYVNMVKAGEAGGILEGVLQRLAAFLETSQAIREEVKSAMVYPLLLTFVGGVSIVVLMMFVIPRFTEIFEELGQTLPASTLLLIGISDFLMGYWWAILGVIAALVALFKTYAGTAEGRLYLDEIKSKTPVISGLHMKLVIARFARTLGTLLQSGVPILTAIGVSRTVIGNEFVSGRLRALEDGVRKGRGVSGPLRESGVFPGVVTQMLAVGEEAGKLDEAFLHVARRYEAEGSRTIKRVVGLVEPVMILLMGLVVAFIVMSMLMAIFSINDIPM